MDKSSEIQVLVADISFGANDAISLVLMWSKYMKGTRFTDTVDKIAAIVEPLNIDDEELEGCVYITVSSTQYVYCC